MIQVIPSNERYHADHGWLSTHWHFSFGDYHDVNNMGFGPLRVFNDDVVQPRSGFGMHPHRDMEIVTYVIDGQLEHTDHLGHRGVIKTGEVQVMSAGKGIVHAEKNPSADRPVNLLQLWLLPRHNSNAPRYDQRAFEDANRRGRLMPVVSGDGAVPDTLAIDQDATIYVSTLAADEAVTHAAAAAGRRTYLFVIKGDVTVNGTRLNTRDQGRIVDEPALDVTAGAGGAEFMLIDLP